jgi:hypothetical protein
MPFNTTIDAPVPAAWSIETSAKRACQGRPKGRKLAASCSCVLIGSL